MRVIHSSEIADDPAAFEGDYVPLSDVETPIAHRLAQSSAGAEPEGLQDGVDPMQSAYVTGWREGFEARGTSMSRIPNICEALESWEQHRAARRSASRETPPVEASPQEHARPVGCPAHLYDGLTPEQGLNVTHVFFAGMSAADREAATPASAEASKEQ